MGGRRRIDAFPVLHEGSAPPRWPGRFGGRAYGSLERECHLCEGARADVGALHLEERLLARDVCVDELLVVISERQRVEDARGPEVRVALHQRLDSGASAVPCPEAAHWHARSRDVRAASEHVDVAAHVRVRDADTRERSIDHSAAEPTAASASSARQNVRTKRAMSLLVRPRRWGPDELCWAASRGALDVGSLAAWHRASTTREGSRGGDIV